REDFLYNIYRMGRNSIERGSRDSWTNYPRRIAQVQEMIDRERRAQSGRQGGPGGGADEAADAPRNFNRGLPARYYEMLRKPEWRDPRGYILPSDQPDFLTATKFVNAL